MCVCVQALNEGNHLIVLLCKGSFAKGQVTIRVLDISRVTTVICLVVIYFANGYYTISEQRQHARSNYNGWVAGARTVHAIYVVWISYTGLL